MAEKQNITLSLPRDLLKRVKRLAAERETSISALLVEALSRLVNEDRRYTEAWRLVLASFDSTRSLGTGGDATWTRDELHERQLTRRARLGVNAGDGKPRDPIEGFTKRANEELPLTMYEYSPLA